MLQKSPSFAKQQLGIRLSRAYRQWANVCCSTVVSHWGTGEGTEQLPLVEKGHVVFESSGSLPHHDPRVSIEGAQTFSSCGARGRSGYVRLGVMVYNK